MGKKKTLRYIIAFTVLVLGICVFFVLNVCIGSVKISLRDVLSSLGGRPVNETVSTIIWNIRLPRTAAVFIL